MTPVFSYCCGTSTEGMEGVSADFRPLIKYFRRERQHQAIKMATAIATTSSTQAVAPRAIATMMSAERPVEAEVT